MNRVNDTGVREKEQELEALGLRIQKMLRLQECIDTYAIPLKRIAEGNPAALEELSRGWQGDNATAYLREAYDSDATFRKDITKALQEGQETIQSELRQLRRQEAELQEALQRRRTEESSWA